MKIVYHHRTRGDGAEGVHIQEMVNAFRKLGHEVIICCPKTAKRPAGLSLGMTGMSSANSKGIRGWIRLKVRQAAEFAYNAVSFTRLTVMLIRCRPDLIYERYSGYHFAGVLASKLCRVPIALEVNSTLTGRFRRRVLAFPGIANFVERFDLKASTCVVVVSEPLRACVEDRTGADKSIVVTPNAINEDQMRDSFNDCDRERKKQELGLSGAVVIGFVGSLRRWHGVDILINQIPKVLESAPNSKFLIVGSGELEHELAILMQREELKGRVIATGGVSHDAVMKLLCAMDIGLMPHSNAWGSPMKILEYMAMGMLTIAPRLAPIEEIVQHGETGILFEPSSEREFHRAIVQACKDSEMRQGIGERARKYVFAERTWVDNAKLVLSEFERMTEKAN